MLLLASACAGGAAAHPSSDAAGGSGSGSSPGTGSAARSVPAPASTVSAAALTILPRSGAADVGTTGALTVRVGSGRLTSVTVTDAEGARAAGSLAADGSSWTPSGALRTGTRYTVSATAVDARGRSTTRTSTFTTLTPRTANAGVFNVSPGAVYGVGMEVSITFLRPVAAADRAAVQRAITVTADPGVPVAGHWFGSSRIDFRPQAYWAAGTRVTLHLGLDGTQTSPGVYDTQEKDVPFSIGRNQTSVADNTTHRLTVYRDGAVYRTLPATLGQPGDETWNGIMVISQKYPSIDMNAETVGLGDAYDIPDVPHAMRLTTSGTFVHGNYWRPVSTFGSANTSHGCIGLHDVEGGSDPSTPAAWFYDNSLVGDVVTVVGSPSAPVRPDNGLNGWNLSWAEWTAGAG
ncbi:Ig-like domain-containing protein [Streptacidiphilus sp. PB12-B1b]|uniref:L,D-transpeptidase n=1 Tax=Streptacidiphilus sp. PB12-B1b TaxID=2705012 RepID=UPI001CDCBDB3|nr:Ig-like domain-containing protein [Streptacidiphilus sp. PB12-B1b]